MMTSKPSAWPLAFLLALALAGCTPQAPPEPAPGPQDPDPADQTVAVSSVSLDETSMSLAVDERKQLSATVFPPNATDPSVSWESDDPGIASVSGGLVTGIAVGQTRIRAKAGTKSAVCKVTVTRKIIRVEAVAISPDRVTLTEGDQTGLTASVLPENADDRSVSWTVGDGNVASVEGAGLAVTLKALAPGRTTVSCTTADGGMTATCEVTVEKRIIHVSAVTLAPAELTLTEEQTATLTATVLPEQADDRSLVWSAEPAGVVAISADGFSAMLTALSAGQVTVTATATDGAVQGSCTITVNALARDADFTQKVFYLWPGSSLTLQAQYSDGRPATPTDWTVDEGGDWLSVSAEGAVSVIGQSDNNGRISARVGDGILHATFWSRLRLSVDGAAATEAALNLESRTSATVKIQYLSAAETFSDLPGGAVGIPTTEHPGVATVSASGSSLTLTAVGSGRTTLSVPVGGVTLTLPVTVTGKIPSDGAITYPEDDYGTL